MSKTLAHNIKSDILLDKSMGLLWSKGYNGTSVNDIVKAAEIPKGSFYFYFKNKEDFAIKAIDKYFKDSFKSFFEILHDESIPLKKRLLKFYEYRISLLKDKQGCRMGCMAANLGNEMGDHNEGIRNIITSRCDIIKTELAAIVEKAQDNNEIKTNINPRYLVEFIEDVFKGSMITMKEMQSSYALENSMNIVKTVLLE